MKVIVLGSSGFVGTNICKSLKKNGINVVKPSREDISKDGLANLLTTDSIVLNCVGKAHVSDTREDKLATFQSANIDFPAELAQACRQRNVKRLIHISSVSVYGDYAKDALEESLCAPKSFYGITKLEGEKKILDETKYSDLNLIILRPPMIYGNGAVGNYELIEKVASIGIPLPFGNVQSRRSVLSIINLTDLIKKIILGEIFLEGIYNVADEKAIVVSDFIKAIVIKKKGRVFSVPLFVLKVVFYLINKKHLFKKLMTDFTVNTDRLNLLWRPPLRTLDAVSEDGYGKDEI
jgi:nucleoside-diphosphate-sugar epimerase